MKVLVMLTMAWITLSCANAQTFAPDDPKVGWQIYGLVNGNPLGEPVELRRGESRRFVIASDYFSVGTHDPMLLRNPPTNIRWSIEPSGKGVEISRNGLVSVGASAMTGTFTVQARSSADTRTATLEVYDPRSARLVGAWTETAQISCQSGEEITPPVRMLELIFEASGAFSATWLPFETRKDYWGTYEYDRVTGNLNLKVADLFNYKPSDLILHGTAKLDVVDGRPRLLLKGIWLGTPPPGVTAGAAATGWRPACGHLFVPR